MPAGAVASLLAADCPPLLARIYAARGIHHPSGLERGLAGLPPPDALRDLPRALALLEEALQAKQRITIVADFDADGATSCALLKLGLETLGAAPVEYVVPNRFEFGYGLSPEIVAVAAAGKPDLLITVDNGTSSIAGVAAARERGMRVLITDHHLPGDRLPEADALINPNQPGDGFPGKNIAGVGVVFYLLVALRARLQQQGWFGTGREAPNLASLLDLVALGTVADVVPLDPVNRILVHQGLARIRAGRGRAGIRALLEVAERDVSDINAGDLAFAAAPRLNAAGRLQDMSLGIECLLATDIGSAMRIAARLDGLNQERRRIEADMREQAMSFLAELEVGADLPQGLAIYDPRWHQGVIGILAARIREQTGRPVVALAQADAGGETLKGSARSIPQVHIRDALDRVASRHPDLLQNFGGHAGAAGLSLRRGDLPRFQAAFAEAVEEALGGPIPDDVLASDGELHSEELSLDQAECLRRGGPWGAGFAEPLFDGVFVVSDSRVVGERHLKLRLEHPNGTRLDGIMFGGAEHHHRRGAQNLAYRLDVNDYQGLRSVQLRVEAIGLELS
ncbi:MAG: single-stranded-DNA-specific exonuclease RecJ [Gammaproteobacteria bacterium]|nr:single-stranded-DNA-specific exonuclease RecJ [Gammaproteobacteria bacterium]